MGPISLDWFRKRGLLEEGSVEPTTYYSGGRIDIRGLDPEEHYNGWGEYSLDVMHGEDWNALSDWLDKQADETVRSYDRLISDFEKDYGRKIRWSKYLKKNMNCSKN